MESFRSTLLILAKFENISICSANPFGYFRLRELAEENLQNLYTFLGFDSNIFMEKFLIQDGF